MKKSIIPMAETAECGLIRFLFSQDMVKNDQDAVGNPHNRFLLPMPTSDSMVLRRQIVVLGVRDRPDDLC